MVSFTQVSPLNPVCTSSIPHTCHMSGLSHSSWFYHPNNIWWEVLIIKFLLTQSTPLSCTVVLLRPQCFPKHRIQEHSQPMFLPQCDRPIFTPIQNNEQIYIFGQQTERQNILHWMRASISCLQYALDFLLNGTWFVRAGSKYLNSFTLTKHLLPIFILYLSTEYYIISINQKLNLISCPPG